MLFQDLWEQTALKELAERDGHLAEMLESFLLTHYATPHPTQSVTLGCVLRS
jgi:hypothetical protein